MAKLLEQTTTRPTGISGTSVPHEPKLELREQNWITSVLLGESLIINQKRW
jgi:hypothetical protein